MAKSAKTFAPKEAFLAFAEWRLRIQFAQGSRKSVLFFRRSRDHSIVWMLVMRGHYMGAPPSVRECQEKAICSRPTTRKMLADAQARGFIDIRAAADDSRKRLVYPSKRAIEEYESMVMGYLSLRDTLGLERKSGRR